MFIELDSKFLSEIATDSDRVPTLYYSSNWAVTKFFWLRLRLIYWMFRKRNLKNNCLDFCGGGGIFLPTLSCSFDSVTFIDLEDIEAKRVIEYFKLKNVNIIKGDVSNIEFKPKSFDVIIAADVLEHFSDLEVPVDILKKILSKDGFLYTSFPTENYFYGLLRKLCRVVKPKDHYHKGYFIEEYLQKAGFVRTNKRYIPFLYIPFFTLFIIGEWRLK